MSDKTIHIIGAGVSGLSAAMEIIDNCDDYKVAIYESTSKAGGRCFSFYDDDFKCMLDNGTHMILGANKNTLKFIKKIDAMKHFVPVEPTVFPFIDIKTTKGWMLKPNAGYIPFWLLFSSRRVPYTKFFDYLKAMKLKASHFSATVRDILAGSKEAYDRLWEPFCVATLNTSPKKASAKLFYNVISKSIFRGKESMCPYIANKSLKASLIDPAVSYLKSKGVKIHLNRKLDGLGIEVEVRELVFADGESVLLKEGDKVILATPVQHTAKLLPTVHFPYLYNPIINVHFKVDKDFSLPGSVPFMGIVNGTAQWIFHKGNIVSVTISDAKEQMKLTAEDVARRAWIDICTARRQTGVPVPPFKIVKEKRATIEHSPDMENLRKPSKTKLDNLIIAGDWTETGLPCTIESGITSGIIAAKIVKTDK